MLREFLTVEVLRILWVCCCSRNTVDDKNVALRTRNYGNYGIFLIMAGNAGFISSTVALRVQTPLPGFRG